MSEVQRQEIEFWADLTIHIGRNHGAPAEQKERFYQGLMILTDPDHYHGCTVMRNLVACLRRELQRAHSEQKWTLHTATPTTRTANQTWPSPWQLPANTQVINPSTHDTITVLSTGNNHSEIHNCTTSPATAKRKAPPPTLTNTPESAPEPRATKNSVNHAPITSPPKMDWWQVQDNKRTTDELRYLEEIRWAVTESMANLAPERNATLENDNNTSPPPSPPNGPAPTKTKAPPPSLTNTPDNAPKPGAPTFNDSPTPTMSPLKTNWWQEEDNETLYSSAIRWVVVHSTPNLASERNATLENDNNIPFPPSPPNGPAPAFTSVPAPPPDEPQDEDGITDAKGITMHKDGWQYKVTVKCKNCLTQYTTRWGTGSDPYKELTNANWEQGRDKSGNWTWQKARCPNYRLGCYNMCTETGPPP